MRYRYHCPYCSPIYQIHKERPDGVMVCGHCGDPLVKASVISLTQVFAVIVAFAFVTPLLMTAYIFIQDLKKPQSQRSMQASSRSASSKTQIVISLLDIDRMI